MLLSTIVWTNRGTGAGAGDTDSFNAIYGGNAGIARSIVDRALDDWERVIVDFNYAGGGNTFNVNISAADLGGNSRGGTGSITNNNGKPNSAVITMDDSGGTQGWYFDATVGTAAIPDDGEFVNIVDPFMATFTAGGAANDDNDFYRTIVHELGHAMGISGGAALLLSGFLTDIGDDPISATPSDRLFSFNSGGVQATFTSNTGLHFYEGPNVPAGNPIHPNDLLNPGRSVDPPPTTRQLISDINARVLQQAYGYTIQLPSTINTFYANLNTTTNIVTITGDINTNGNTADVIDLEVTGASMRFEANGTSEVIPGAEFSTIQLFAGNGDDDIDLDALLSGKTVTVGLQAGNDSLDVALEVEDLDNVILSNFTVDGGSGNDTVRFHDRADLAGSDTWTISSTTAVKGVRTMTYNLVELLDIRGSDNVTTTYNIDATPSATAVDILAGAIGDIFNVGNGDFDSNIGGPIFLSAGGGNDALNIDDTLDGPSGDVYDFNIGEFSKPGQVIDYTQIEAISVLGSDEPSTYRINATTATLTIAAGDGADTVRIGNAVGSVIAGQEDITAIVSVNGGLGNDTFFVGNGDLDEMSATVIISDAGGDDSMFVNDSDDGGADTYTLVDGLLTKTAGGGVFLGLNYSFINAAQFDLNGGANIFNFTNGFGFPVLQGNGGADTFNIISTSTTPTIRGGPGLDNVVVNEDEAGTASIIFDQDEDLAALELYIGSTVTVAQVPGDVGIVTGSFGFARGTLNLNDNFLVVQNPSISFLVDKLTRGYNGGAWNGAPAGGALGVIRSATAANSALGDGLGYAEIGAGAAQLNIASYLGAEVAPGNLVISYTLYGDSDLNRTVNLADFNRLAAAFGVSNTLWTQGNFNFDNATNLADFNLLAGAFGASVTPGFAGMGRTAAIKLDDLMTSMEQVLV